MTKQFWKGSGDRMTVQDKFTGLMNAVRSMSGTAGKLSTDDATSIVGSAGQWGVRVPNITPQKSQSGQPSVKDTKNTTNIFDFSNVQGQETYSASVYVENAPADLHLRLFIWDKSWKYAASTDGTPLAKGESGKLAVQVTAPKGMLSPGVLRCSLILEQEAKGDVTINYKDLMVNKGDYAPYTSATKPYTVDSLAERLTALEKKVGGGAKPVLTAFSRSLKGGVAYVA